jgi:hypothetical protein
MATTRDIERLIRTYIDPKVADNAYNSTPLLKRFRSKAKMRNGLGKHIVEPLETETGLAASYAELATLDRTRKEITNEALYYLSQYYSPLTVSWKDMLTCRGPEDVVDLLMVKARNAEKDLGRKLTADLVSGTGTGSGAEPTLVGIATMVPTTNGTIGGLAQASNAFWVNQRTNGSSATPTIPQWIQMMAKCTDGSDGPTIAFTDKFLLSYIWANLLQQQERYTTGKFNMGESLPMVAGLPVITDAAFESGGATGGKIFFINEEYMFLRVHSADNFKRWPYEKPVDQFAYSTYWTWSGSLCANNLKRQGVIYSLTTT